MTGLTSYGGALVPFVEMASYTFWEECREGARKVNTHQCGFARKGIGDYVIMVLVLLILAIIETVRGVF
jgi:hypothetical protein